MLATDIAISFALLATGISNLIWAWGVAFPERHAHVFTFEGMDYPQELPMDLSEPVAMTMEESTRYALNGNLSLADWDSLDLPGNGFFHLGTKMRLLVVSISHEMHCISSLAHAFHQDPDITESHAGHCLGYLRNAALCAADVTLEPGALGTRDFGRRQPGATHICRDWKAMEGWMIQNWKEWKEQTSPTAGRPVIRNRRSYDRPFKK